ncbi:hypothetical protein [Streptomyces sp. KL2]|uniref:hypothetical protein n=1 Tax=Streptomyces sp. KL2 TaxID=3050126 RepID=UPI00397C2F89
MPAQPGVPAAGQGTDAAEKTVRRGRSIVTGALGLLAAVLVTAASVQDSDAGRILAEQAAAERPSVRRTWADGGHRRHLAEHAATLGVDPETVRRTPAPGVRPAAETRKRDL